MHRLDALMTGDRHILSFDPEGSGRIAEVFGDLDTAQRVSVIVPGVDTDLLTFQKTYKNYTAPVGMAQNLYAAENTAKSATDTTGTRTAVIAWADYTAPGGLGIDSATAGRAEAGAVRLNALVRALPGTSRIALFCHSYGSVVCGVAAHELPARVTDIAVAKQPRNAHLQRRPPAHTCPGVGDAGRERLDPGRAVHGARRPRARRGPGVERVRRAGAGR